MRNKFETSWFDLRGWLFPVCLIMSRIGGNRREDVFFTPEDYEIYRK